MTYLELKEIGSGNDFQNKYSEIMRMWAIPIVLTIERHGEAGFNQIKKDLKEINSTTLSSTLAILEKYGMLERVIIPAKPIRVRYSLTGKGKEFYKIALNLAEFLEEA